ncbi:MAG: class I SAM-dependent methyltransferase [Candidatus Uhrbacteria bacterium]
MSTLQNSTANHNSFASLYQSTIQKKGGHKQYIQEKKQRSAGALITRLQHNFEPGSRIIEIGTGTGAIAALLAKEGFQITAIDNDPAMIKLAKESKKAMNVTVDIHEFDAFKIHHRFASNAFECAISHGLIEHFSDNEISQLLQAQNLIAKQVVFVVPTAKMSPEYNKRGLGNERYLTTPSWIKLLTRIGFRVSKIYGFGFKETSWPTSLERLCWYRPTARLVSPVCAFNEFWLQPK